MKKIFVTVGNDFHSFHRIIMSVDELAKKIDAEISVQYGYSSYVPKNIEKKFKFLDRDDFYKEFMPADLILSHSGIGTMIDSIRYKKKMVIVPRQKKFDEHFNDHQLEIAHEVEGKYENIKLVYDVEDLEGVITSLLNKQVKYPKAPDIKSLKMVANIRDFLENEEKR